MEALFLPVLLFAVASTLLCVGLLPVGAPPGPQRDTVTKEMPYESGMNPIHDTHRRFDVRFHLVAIAFLIFDVELLFLYPWAVANRDENGLVEVARQNPSFSVGLVFCEVLFFVVLLAAGFVYVLRRGVFRWR